MSIKCSFIGINGYLYLKIANINKKWLIIVRIFVKIANVIVIDSKICKTYNILINKHKIQNTKVNFAKREVRF